MRPNLLILMSVSFFLFFSPLDCYCRSMTGCGTICIRICVVLSVRFIIRCVRRLLIFDAFVVRKGSRRQPVSRSIGIYLYRPKNTKKPKETSTSLTVSMRHAFSLDLLFYFNVGFLQFKVPNSSLLAIRFRTSAIRPQEVAATAANRPTTSYLIGKQRSCLEP